MSENFIAYHEWAPELFAQGVELPAWVHGIVCAQVIAENNPSCHAHIEQWLSTMLQEEESVQVRTQSIVTRGRNVLRNQLYNVDFDLQLMIPGDDEPLAERIIALGGWCAGFLKGLELIEHPKFTNHPEVMEAINDLAEIVEIEEAGSNDAETDETALFQLIEYVRVAVMFIFTECVLDETPTEQANDISY